MIDKIKESFKTVFGAASEPLIVRSPGRVNIIGEHTDYNDGFVLPAAIDKAIYIAATKRDDGQVHLYSVDFKESYENDLSAIQPTDTWSTYILGVADQLIKRGYKIGGFNMALDGDVPIGAGLSSSAAVECAAAFALSTLFDLNIDRLEMVKIAQKSEQTYAGVMCGIMDQFASAFGKKNYVIKLDCRTLNYEYVPLHLDGYKLLLLNSNVKHSLASSEYNTRRQQCEQGVSWVKEVHPEVISLRDVTIDMLNGIVLPKDELIYKRCKYVVEEKDRLLTGCEALKAGDLGTLGKKMFETHYGLSKEYEVSCKELDYLVDAVKDNPAVLGARMMGGGFGGCTINIVKEDAIDNIIESLKPGYIEHTGLELTAYVAQIEDGTGAC